MAIYGPYDDYTPSGGTQPYKAFYHPYKGKALAYRIKYPESYDPTQEYGVIVHVGGGGIGNTKSETYNLSMLPENATGALDPVIDTGYLTITDWMRKDFTDYIYIVVKPQDWEGWNALASEQSENVVEQWIYAYTPPFGNAGAIIDLIDNIRNGTSVHYTTYDSGDGTFGDAMSYARPKINNNKIVLSGCSMGGAWALNAAIRLRDRIAGVMAFAGWLYGDTKDIYSEGSYYTYPAVLRLPDYAEVMSEIPFILVHGNTDASVSYKHSLELCNAFDLDKSYLIYSTAGHSNSLWWSVFTSTNRINTGTHTQQTLNTSAESATNKNVIDIVSGWSKPEITREIKPYLLGDMEDLPYKFLWYSVDYDYTRGQKDKIYSLKSPSAKPAWIACGEFVNYQSIFEIVSDEVGRVVCSLNGVETNGIPKGTQGTISGSAYISNNWNGVNIVKNKQYILGV